MYPTLPKEAVMAIAARKGLIQWFPSHRVERLRIGVDGVILATNLVTGYEHPVSLRRESYWCKVVERNDLIRLGDLLQTY